MPKRVDFAPTASGFRGKGARTKRAKSRAAGRIAEKERQERLARKQARKQREET